MPNFDVLLLGGTAVGDYGEERLDIGIVDGRIAATDANLAGSAGQTIDVGGCLLMPGAIDPHVHFNEPGRTEWEGWASGSRALVAGGATCAIEMPLNAHPPTLDRDSFEQKRAAAEASSLVDFALWGGLTPANLDNLAELAACGVVGFKAFMSTSGTDDFPAADDLTLYKGMAKAAELGLPVAVHAENDVLTRGLAADAVRAGRTGWRDYASSRPVIAELEAVTRAIQFAGDIGCALHIVHVSSGAAVSAIAQARAGGIDVTCETCPHYLAFTEVDLATHGALFKCAPPLRDAATVESLWAALRGGGIDMLASDHSPAPPDMKDSVDAFAVWGGIAGCQHLRAAMLTAGKEHHLEASDIVRLTSSAVAARFRLPNKGSLVVGADADIGWGVHQPPREIARSDIAYRHPASAWDGVTFTWRHIGTMVRGQVVYRGGTFLPASPARLLRPLAQ